EPSLRAGDEPLAGHAGRHRLGRHDPALVAQLGVDGRAAIGARLAAGVLEDLAHLRIEGDTAPLCRCGLAVAPLVEPALADLECPAGDRVRDAMVGPLGGDERGQAHPVASLTQRTTDRLSTSRSISSSAQRRRSRTSSSRSFAVRPSASPRSTRSLFTQLPSVPSWIPSSRTTVATGLPVSRTIRTAP